MSGKNKNKATKVNKVNNTTSAKESVKDMNKDMNSLNVPSENTMNVKDWKSWEQEIANLYSYKGVKNETDYKEFVEICKYVQKELIDELPKRLLALGYENVIVENGFIYAKGTVPVLLTAHMDTVHKEPVKDFYDFENENHEHIISSPQGIGGDDRCGIYMILEIIKEHKCSVLFCEDEEVGGIGSSKFCNTKYIEELKEMNYLIELDRANAMDAVFYECDNLDFTEFITKETGFSVAYGTFSDICHLSPSCGIASVNFSCGYYHAHTVQEEVNMTEMLYVISVVKKLLYVESKQYEFIPYNAYYDDYDRYYNRRYDSRCSWYDDYDMEDNYRYDERNGKKSVNIEKNNLDDVIVLYVSYLDELGYETETEYYAPTLSSAWGKFFLDNAHVCYNDVLDYYYETK